MSYPEDADEGEGSEHWHDGNDGHSKRVQPNAVSAELEQTQHSGDPECSQHRQRILPFLTSHYYMVIIIYTTHHHPNSTPTKHFYTIFGHLNTKLQAKLYSLLISE